MPIDLLGYTGNAGLGLGASPDINVDNVNLSTLDGTMKNMALLDNEKNINLFNQKIKDRNNLEGLILQNQVSTGEIDPNDQKYFDSAKDNVEKAYTAWGGNPNDTNGFRKYQAAVTDLQNTATHAQTRWAGLKKQQQELSQETLPSRIKARKAWLDQQEKQPFGSQITPYQQLHDFSIDDILSGVNPVKGSIVDPNNPVSYDTETVDYGDILKNKNNQYLNDKDVADSIDQFTTKLANYDQPQLKKAIDATNARIDDYNQERGFKEGDQGYVDHVKVNKNADGTILLAEPKVDLAAKWALASQPSYVTKTPKFNKDILKAKFDQTRLAQDQEKINLKAKEVGIEQAKANAYIKHLSAATDKVLHNAQQEGTDIGGEYNTFIDNIKPGAIAVTTGGKKIGSIDAIYTDEIPGNFQYINGPIVNPKTGRVAPGRLVPFDSGGSTRSRPYYIPKYINPSTGEKLDLNNLPPDINEGYLAAKKAGVSKEDFIRILLKKGTLELQLQGKNGIANYTSLSQSAKLMNNEATKKGQENIINAPEENPNAEDNSSDTNPENN
jgi:hypothetical protein